jgi:hypothetical protein
MVQGITRITPGCSGPKIIVTFFGCGAPYYQIELATAASGLVRTGVGAAKVNEDDLRRILGARVTIKCYRKPDQTGPGCSQQASSITADGRELVRP